jgi:iron complex transport system permease protein
MSTTHLQTTQPTHERERTHVFFVGLLSLLMVVVVVGFALWVNTDNFTREMFFNLRLPRVLAAFGVGALLALAGILLQALLRNPLAEPYMLGAASGASFFVLLGMLFGASWWVLQGLAFIGAVLVLLLMLFMLTRFRRADGDVTILLLLGVLLAAVLNAAVSAVLLVLPNQVLRGALFWMMGDLAGAGRYYLGIGGALLCLMLALPLARPMAAMMRGSVLAHSAGVNVARLRWQLLLLAGLASSIAVAEAGAIGFIGLVVPHTVKLFTARLSRLDLRAVMLLCALWGGILLVLADVLARTVLLPIELPVGIFTTLIGAPFFAWQLVRRMKGGA